MTGAQGPRPPTFDQFHLAATGQPPPGHQARIAADGLPREIQFPAGTGPAGVILAWLWRYLHGPGPVRALTPRRLIWALPQGALLEPTVAAVRRWLTGLELAQSVALHVVAGARGEDVGDWREDMHRPAIIVGPADALVSKALNRGYGLSRAMFPIDFALAVNGAHWVIDEARLSPRSAATLRQLADYAEARGTAEPFGLTLISTEPPAVAFRRLAVAPGDYRAIAASAVDRHAPGTRTLVVLNTVAAAQQVYRQLRGGPALATLLHSRFRGTERAGRLSAIPGGPEGVIVVATPVVEAGFGDLDASLLITETAPWPSLVLRAGHGKRGEVLWVPPPSGHLPAPGHPPAADHRAVIQPSQLVTLFDTSTYRSDDDIDIAPYLRDAEDLDAEVAWATWTPGAAGAPDPEVRLPLAEHRCRIGLAEALRLAEGRAVWRFDRDAGAWTPVTGHPPSRLRPGELLLVNAADGGYDTETGLDPLARALVPDSPVLLTPDEQAPPPAGAAPGPAAGEGTEGDPGPASAAPRRWQSLDEHSEQVRDQVAALLAAIAPPGLPSAAARSAVIAGWLHDVGKAHPIWQDALCALAEADERDKITAGRPWAKSGARTGRLEFAGDVPFRHELASLLLIDDSLGDLLSQAPDQDLARFLVVAHHGKLRVQIREPAAPDAVGGGEPALSALGAISQIRGLRQGARWPIPPMLGHPASTLTVDLGQFTSDGNRSWTNVVLSLLARYGPFTLAYLETIVRVADWRASGGRELAQPNAATDADGRLMTMQSISMPKPASYVTINLGCHYRRPRRIPSERGGGAGACGSPRAAATPSRSHE